MSGLRSGILIAASMVGIGNLTRGEPPESGNVIPPAPVSTAGGESGAANHLQVRYAVARLRLAELDLERALAINAAAAHAIGEREIARLRNHVALLERQVAIARRHPRTAARQVTIAAAEAGCADARADLAAAERAAERLPDSVSQLNIDRLRAKLDVATIRLELCQSPEYELSLLAELEWNVEQLTDELIDLRHKVETKATRDPGER